MLIGGSPFSAEEMLDSIVGLGAVEVVVPLLSIGDTGEQQESSVRYGLGLSGTFSKLCGSGQNAGITCHVLTEACAWQHQ